ncbi:MAG: glycosyltransferase family 4 protein [Planctomycetes bacterium]|nr:glycosyltransferase family 4 protein [Planctomycetota bacterium]
MRVLTFSTLYPNAAMEGHGVFVENRARHLAREPGVEMRVVAPVPWFPFRSEMFGRYAAGARAPREELRGSVTVTHPRYAHLPHMGAWLAPWAIYQAARRHIARLMRHGYDFDVLDAHYVHPDGAAGAMLADAFDKPLVITARGSDVTQLPDFRLRRRLIERALTRADQLVAVCKALVPFMQQLGAPLDRVTVLRNGVDLDMFRPPMDRGALRRELHLTRLTLLSVGHLVARKGHDLAIRTLLELPDSDLLIVGDGIERHRLELLTQELGLADRVRFLGARPHAELGRYYGAADALLLASSREGWANVLLEAMACGTPAVATHVGGSPEVVSSSEAGELALARDPKELAAAVHRLLARGIDRAATRRHAERHSWNETSRGQIEVFRRAIALHAARRQSGDSAEPPRSALGRSG